MANLLIRDARIVPFRSRTELARQRASHARTFGAEAPPAHPSPASGREPGVTGASPATGDASPATGASLTHLNAQASPPPVDIRIEGGLVVDVGNSLPHRGEEVLDAGGAFAIPGLWDAHAHLDLEAAKAARIDTLTTTCAEDALALVAEAIRALPNGPGPATVQGFGHRLSNWPRVPTVAELDAVTGPVPTVLVSGDVHSGWLNSAALRILGLPAATDADPGEPMREDPWFAVLDRLDDIPGTRELRESGYRTVFADMLAKGVTGVVDMSWADGPDDWGARLAAMAEAGTLPAFPRIRACVYRDKLDAWIAAGLRTGMPLAGSPTGGDGLPLFTQGPLKVIADGSLGAASAHMCEPYPAELGAAHPHGIANIGRDELTALMARGNEAGFEMAIHAIGDAAMNDVAAAFAASGARGRLEHAQLLPEGAAGDGGALATLVARGIEFSIQPAHLIDDWAAIDRIWPGRRARTYAFADLLAAGGLLHLGSDAPVAPLDPWLAMSAAVGRRTPDGSVWSADQRLSIEEALASSVDGAGPLGAGSKADIALLPENPLTLDDAALAALRPLATIVAGSLAFG